MSKTNRKPQDQTWISAPFSDGEVKARVYRGAARTLTPLIVYCHGGLFNSGSLQSADALATKLANMAAVISVDYPLAPAQPFPAAPNAVFAILNKVAKSAAEFGADARRLFIAGDEAGANLAAVVAMMSRDRGGPKLAGQILITPLLDPCLTTESMRKASGCPCQQAWSDYLPNATDRIHPYAAPLQSLRVAQLAPALIVSGENDPTRDEAELYAAKLIAAGVVVQARRFADSTHGLARPDHPKFPDTIAAIEQFIAELPLVGRV